jgi:hypothetical protein
MRTVIRHHLRQVVPRWVAAVRLHRYISNIQDGRYSSVSSAARAFSSARRSVRAWSFRIAAACSTARASATVIVAFGTLVQATFVSIVFGSGARSLGAGKCRFSVAATRSRSLPLDAPRGFESSRAQWRSTPPGCSSPVVGAAWTAHEPQRFVGRFSFLLGQFGKRITALPVAQFATLREESPRFLGTTAPRVHEAQREASDRVLVITSSR